VRTYDITAVVPVFAELNFKHDWLISRNLNFADSVIIIPLASYREEANCTGRFMTSCTGCTISKACDWLK
jgi:hypothetical protein